jgi:hypothetical protein
MRRGGKEQWQCREEESQTGAFNWSETSVKYAARRCGK